MKVINVNVTGTPTDTPTLSVDNGVTVSATLSPGRASFALPDNAALTGHGATISYGGKSVRVLVPPFGSWEADQPPVKPPEATSPIVLAYTPRVPDLSVSGSTFLANGARWLLQGVTDFRLLDLLQFNPDLFAAIVDQRMACGANTFRILCMKTNNTGWMLSPASPQTVMACQDALEQRGARGLFTVFADTKFLMPKADEQQTYWHQVCAVLRQPHLGQLANEADHPTQQLDPSSFARPTTFLCCHGSRMTDEDPVRPRWDFAGYSARRDRLPDARGITNYDPSEFQAVYPQPCPLLPLEGLKPPDYGCDPEVARCMGAHAALGAGGVFHTDEGVNGALWSAEIEACAREFFGAME